MKSLSVLFHASALLASASLAGASLSACAQSSDPSTPATPGAQQAAQARLATAAPAPAAGTPAARADAALRSVDPQVRVDSVGDAPMPGFQQAVVNGQVVYVSNDGKYLVQGRVFDVAAKRDLSEAAMAKVRRGLLEKVPMADRIVFSPPAPKHRVVVFTDVECGYCRKLHSEIAEYNRQGIAVEYLAYPRMGVGSPDFQKMVDVWCAPDRKRALTDAKNDRKVPTRQCTSPVRMQYDIGQRAGLTGTPMILAEDGTYIAGYLPPLELRMAMERHEAQVAAAGG